MQTCPACFSIYSNLGTTELSGGGVSVFQLSLVDVYQWDLSERTLPPFTEASFHVRLAH